jgi:tetratricopeptide (TPR) repeat protein
LGRYQEAIEFYDKALAIDDEYIVLISNKGLALLGNYEEAQQWFNKALSIDGNYTEALIGKGLVPYDLDKTHEALQLIDKAFTIEPAYMKFLSEFGIPFTNTTDSVQTENEQAVAWLDKLLLVPPERINELITSNRLYVLKQILGS